MKKIYTLFLTVLLLSTIKTSATIVNVTVADFQFSPANFTINAGDTIIWTWLSGAHTTTSDNIPSGAMSWDEPIDQSSPFFIYIPLVGGTYNYECDFHSQMQASFTVVGTVGIGTHSADLLWLNSSQTSASEWIISYSLPTTGMVDLKMFDLLGNTVHAFSPSVQSEGVNTKTINVAGLAKGIYILRLEMGDATIARKIMLQ